jgi:hypothetical protein
MAFDRRTVSFWRAITRSACSAPSSQPRSPKGQTTTRSLAMPGPLFVTSLTSSCSAANGSEWDGPAALPPPTALRVRWGACPSRASGWSSLTTLRGFPCCVRFPCVHAAATTPAQRLGVSVRSVTQPYQPSPKGLSGRPARRPFRGLLGVHSRCGLHTRAVTNS